MCDSHGIPGGVEWESNPRGGDPGCCVISGGTPGRAKGESNPRLSHPPGPRVLCWLGGTHTHTHTHAPTVDWIAPCCNRVFPNLRRRQPSLGGCFF